MPACRCFIVPPHILRGLSESNTVNEVVRHNAKANLRHLEDILAHLSTAEGSSSEQQIFSAGPKGPSPGAPSRAIHDAENSFNESSLPGTLVRKEGDPPVADHVVNDAYRNVGVVLNFYKERFNWNSIDNKNMDVVSTVHFGKEYENAFWDPEKLQMVFGDGDEFLRNFTGCIDVIGHELCHAVTDKTSPLDYWGMPGALNEHVSDVFGIMIKQKVQNEDSMNADWLIGEDCILPGVKGTALRSMKNPGQAYDDPRFGKDPQVAHMKFFKTMYEDNGGVHIYSGIPNKAFHLTCVAFGGYSWEMAGQIWWKTMTSKKIPRTCTFEQFARVTIDSAQSEYGEVAAKKVRKAWHQVGIDIPGPPEPDYGSWKCNIL